MIDMIRHDILPAVSAYADQLCQRAYHKDSMGAAHKYEKATAAEVAQLTDELMDACVKLESDMAAVPADAKEAMQYSHATIVPDMAAARTVADKLETITASEYWPFPVYSDMLFYV